MKHRIIPISLVSVLMLLLIIFPEKYIISVQNGLSLYAISVLPALFPFFFFSKILTELNFGYDLGNMLKKPLKKLYNAPSISGYILIMSMLSGYPVGAKLIADCHSKKLIDSNQARALSSFCSTSGPLFIVGTVGIGMLHDKTVGFLILISHYLATLINGLIYRKTNKSDSCEIIPPPVNVDSVLSDSIISSIKSVLIVGGYIAIFNLVLDVFTNLRILEFICRALRLLGVDNNLSLGVMSGLIEITKGSLILSLSAYPLARIAPLIAFVITFGGMSVTLQSMTFLAKCSVKPSFYLLTKFTQGLLSSLIMFILGLLFL